MPKWLRKWIPTLVVVQYCIKCFSIDSYTEPSDNLEAHFLKLHFTPTVCASCIEKLVKQDRA